MTVWEAIYDWLSFATMRPVVKGHEDGRLPNRPAIAAKVIADRRVGHAAIGELQEDGVVLIQQESLLTVSIRCFGDGAYELAQIVRNSVNRITIRDRLRLGGLAFVDCPLGPVDMTRVVGTTNEERYQLDMRLRTMVELEDDVGIIELVELTTTINGQSHTGIIGV